MEPNTESEHETDSSANRITLLRKILKRKNIELVLEVILAGAAIWIGYAQYQTSEKQSEIAEAQANIQGFEIINRLSNIDGNDTLQIDNLFNYLSTLDSKLQSEFLESTLKYSELDYFTFTSLRYYNEYVGELDNEVLKNLLYTIIIDINLIYKNWDKKSLKYRSKYGLLYWYNEFSIAFEYKEFDDFMQIHSDINHYHFLIESILETRNFFSKPENLIEVTYHSSNISHSSTSILYSFPLLASTILDPSKRGIYFPLLKEYSTGVTFFPLAKPDSLEYLIASHFAYLLDKNESLESLLINNKRAVPILYGDKRVSRFFQGVKDYLLLSDSLSSLNNKTVNQSNILIDNRLKLSLDSLFVNH